MVCAGSFFLSTIAESGVVVLVFLAVPVAVVVCICAALSKQADPIQAIAGRIQK